MTIIFLGFPDNFFPWGVLCVCGTIIQKKARIFLLVQQNIKIKIKINQIEMRVFFFPLIFDSEYLNSFSILAFILMEDERKTPCQRVSNAILSFKLNYNIKYKLYFCLSIIKLLNRFYVLNLLTKSCIAQKNKITTPKDLKNTLKKSSCLTRRIKPPPTLAIDSN